MTFLSPEGVLLPKQAVTVSAIGTHSLTSGVPNMGADFGPDSKLGTAQLATYGPSYSTTSGIQEAINYLSTSPRAGGKVLLDPDASYAVSSTITVPSNISIESSMGGGEIESPPVLVSPGGSVVFTGSTGPCFVFQAGTTSSGLTGVAVTGVPGVSGALVELTGCKQVRLVDCFIRNLSGIGIQADGLAAAPFVTENCNISRTFIMGNPAIQIGVPTGSETTHPRNFVWDDVTAEGVNFATGSAGYILIARYGYYHLFSNFVSRGSGAQIHVQNDASLIFGGGELTTATAATVGLQVDGGEVVLDNLTLTLGTHNISGGTLRLRRVIAGIAPNLTIAVAGSGVLDVDRDSSLPAPGVTLTQAGAGSSTYLPSGARSVGPLAAPPAGATFLPGNRTGTLTANPPVLGAVYLNTSNSRLTIMVPVNLVPGAAAGGVQGHIGPTAALGTNLPAIAAPAAAAGIVVRYDIIVPAGWSWQITITAGAPTLGLALAFGEAMD
jgi:hypothetical protein